MTNDELSIASPPVPTILHTNNWLASKFLLHQGTPPRKKVTETSTPLRYTARKQSYTSFFCRGEPSPNTRKFREGSLQGVWGGAVYGSQTVRRRKNIYINHRRYKTDTELSNFIWKLKDEGIEYKLQWKIIYRGRSFNTLSKVCQLCTNEKIFVLLKPELCTLNSNNELGSYCRHQKKTPSLQSKKSGQLVP